MSTVAAVVVTDLTIRMVTTMLVHPIGVDHNHHLTVSPTMPTDTNPTQRGVQVVMVLSTVTEVLEDVRV
tara:strand:- start:1138 stop:1344 length:207 start_codon:yes stop_codon:yes gene_type:complete